ncbi:putative diguanylate cyclase YegE [Methyloligella halotolerans]|uniref:Putative diguanylate cyclase YegE n=1 Tax=Methyloligella halotolerans TaxID=1177755 RepID=A0A1E2RUV9_9HYPH|nr:putative diguanylate cyclase YegE [Methyloligella halotolerans]
MRPNSMLSMATLNKNGHWFAFAFLGLLICAIAFFAPARVSKMQLEREAQTAASRISEQITDEPGYLFDSLAKRSLAPRVGELLEQMGYGPRVLRYEIYDKDGQLVFTSGNSAFDLTPDLEASDAETATGDASPYSSIKLYQGGGLGAPDYFAALSIPIKLGGQPEGKLTVYLDQSEQARVLAEYFGLIAVVTMLLLAVGIAAPVAFAWMRSKERYQAEEQLRFLKDHDALTGLPNRAAFTRLLSDALNHMHRNRTHIAVLCVDVDKFKEINDSLDHAGGDVVLREIATRIGTTIRKGDLFGRLGGDEFAVALVEITNLAT